MTKTIKLFAAIATLIVLYSFTNKPDNGFIGTYGVSESDPSEIKLTINPDHTFYYQDFSNANNKITTNGTWTLKKNKLVLNSTSGAKFHNVWTIDENGQVAKSRKGLSFYRLGRTGA